MIETTSFSLTPEEITLLNPNTGTCPVFRTRRDAEITLGIYKRVPVLVKENDPNGNPWGVKFMTMFHMSNDSHLFHTRDELETDGWYLDGNVFIYGKKRMLPLYQGMMTSLYDHRAADIAKSEIATTRQSQPLYLTSTEKDDSARLPQPRYWVDERELLNSQLNPILGFSNVIGSSNERTFAPFILPNSCAGHSIQFIECEKVERFDLLLACASSFVYDYVARIKVGGVNMSYFIVRQLPVIHPAKFLGPAPWIRSVTVGDWIKNYTLELFYTAIDMVPAARFLDDLGKPFRWSDERRALLLSELDAAFFILYGLSRDDVSYVLDTFSVVQRKDVAEHGNYRTKRLILDVYDRMAEAIRTGHPYQTILDPPPGQGPRHPAKRGAGEV